MTKFYSPDQNDTWDRETRTHHLPEDAPRADLDDLFVVPPTRPVARGQVHSLAATAEAGTYLAGYATGAPRVGDRVKVIVPLPRYERSTYGPPTVVGFDLSQVREGVVVESPWMKRGGKPWETFRVHVADWDRTFDVNFAVAVEA